MGKITVLLELTRKCNLLCKHCYNSSSLDSPLQLSIDEVEILIKDIKKIQRKYEIERIILTGGEFVTMDNSIGIFKMFRKNFDCILRIETNGFLFYNNKELLNKYEADEFFISIDKLHATLNDDGSSKILDFFLENTDKNIIARITINSGMEDLRDTFIEKYQSNEHLRIEAKYVSPSGRAGENFEKFKGYKFSENPELFKCLAKNYIHFNVSRNWYCCYTACELSRFAKLGENNLIDKFEKTYLSSKMCAIREKGMIELLDDSKNKEEFYEKEFYYRCEPCLYLQKLHAKKIILVDLPCVDTAQDVYTKGFVFPTFTEKYLKKILEDNGVTVYYYNLNKCSLKESIKEINELGVPIYIHLVANKYYSFNLFKKIVKNKILLGGPLPKMLPDEFKDMYLIGDELEEDGILKFLGVSNKNVWNNPTFCPQKIDNKHVNKSVTNDFANIILLSRGCLYRCNFCIHACYHKNVHLRDIQSVKLELNNYKNLSTSIYIADASIGNLKLYGEILDLLSSYKNIKFSMNIRADQINENTINKIKKINIDRLYIGVEDTNDEVLKKYNKGEKSEDIINALDLLRRNKIEYHLSFIVTNDLLNKSLDDIHKKYNAKSYSFHYYIPYPGTYGYSSLEYFNDRYWPNKIFDDNLNIVELKKEISKYFGYPVNNYHTITPHDHTETFIIIDKKLKELESLVDENNR